MNKTLLEEKLKVIRKRIELACSKAKRNVGEVKPVWVSKKVSVDTIRDLFSLGERVIAENKAQELKDKILPNFKASDYECHFIGHLQSNKIKFVIPHVGYVHSLDRISLAEKINLFLANHQSIMAPKFLIEVNTSGEERKGGLHPDEVYDFVEQLQGFEHLKIVGLMTMAPFTKNEKIIRECFSKLRELRDEVVLKNQAIKELSMGMSSDFELAIEEGATIIRVGSLLFGERKYS